MNSSKRKATAGNGAESSGKTGDKKTKLEENPGYLLSEYLKEKDFKMQFSDAFRYVRLMSFVTVF